MAIPGTVTVTGVIAPTVESDIYPVTDAKYGLDGLRNVLNKTERNQISYLRRRAGMVVGVSGASETEYWSLKPEPWNYDDSDWVPFLSKSISVTKTEIDNLIINNQLIIGQTYQISNVDIPLYDDGNSTGTTIILQAVATNKLATDGYGIFYNPKYNQAVEGFGIWTNISKIQLSNISVGQYDSDIINNNGGTAFLYGGISSGMFWYNNGNWSAPTSISGIYNTAFTATVVSVSVVNYNIGDKVIYGGYSWTNLNGNVGDAVDFFTLDGEWSKDVYNEINYNKVIDAISYDYENDIITRRYEIIGDNEVSYSKADINSFSLSTNPISAFMFGNPYNRSTSIGIGQNKVYNSLFDCINFRGGFVINNLITMHSNIFGNSFNELTSFERNTLSKSQMYENVLTVGSYINLCNLDYSEISLNNLYVYSYITSNSLYNNSRISENTLDDYSSIIRNSVDISSDILNNVLNASSINKNTVKNESRISLNTLLNGSSININEISNSSRLDNNLLDNNEYLNNFLINDSYVQDNEIVSLRQNTVTNYSYILQNIMSGINVSTAVIFFNEISDYSGVVANTFFSGGYITNNVIKNTSAIDVNYIYNSSDINNNNMAILSRISYNSLLGDASVIKSSKINIASGIFSNNLEESSILDFDLSNNSVYGYNNLYSAETRLNIIKGGSIFSGNTIYSSDTNSNTILNNSEIFNNTFGGLGNFLEFTKNTIDKSKFENNILSGNTIFQVNKIVEVNFLNNTIYNSQFISNSLNKMITFGNFLNNSGFFENYHFFGYITGNNLYDSNMNGNNIQGGAIYTNNLTNNSAIRNNTLIDSYGINANNFSSTEIRDNTLENDSNISSTNLFNCIVQYNTISNNSRISLNTNNPLTGKTIQYIFFENGTLSDIQLSAATVVFGSYPKTIFRLPNSTQRLRYYDNSGNLIITGVTA